MAIQKPIIFGGAIAFLLWLMTRKGAAQEAEAKTRVIELGEESNGALATQVDGGETTLIDVGFTLDDEETGICTGASDAFGNSISCLEHDKRLLEAQAPGAIGAESNG